MKKFLALLVIAAMTLMSVSAFAYDVKVDDDTFAKVGAKAQIRVTSIMPETSDGDVDVALQQGRIYFAGQVTNLVKFGVNFDFQNGNFTAPATGTLARANDGFIMLDFAKEAKLMTGIYRVAFSRVGLQDSYQYILIEAPSVVNEVADVSDSPLATFRGAGITLWGDLMDGKLRYNVGIWDDENTGLAAPSDDKYMMSGRVVLNLADSEKGYTCPGCYLGKANVMSVGFGYLTQDSGNLTATAMTADFFYDQGGTTLEAAYVMSDNDAGTKPSGLYVEAAQTFGNWQPAARFETYDSDGGVDYDAITAGINYLWSGHDAKVQFAYSMKDNDGATEDIDTLTAQLQVQF